MICLAVTKYPYLKWQWIISFLRIFSITDKAFIVLGHHFSVLCYAFCVFSLSLSCVLCGQCYQCLWFVHFWLPLLFSLTCILTECTWWRIYQKRIVSIKLYLRFYYRAEFSVKNEILFNWSRCDLLQNIPERNGDKDTSSQIKPAMESSYDTLYWSLMNNEITYCI